MDLHRLQEFCAHAGMPLSAVQVQAFEDYAASLYRLNEVMNLTRVPREECEVRHFIDSLLVAEFLPSGCRVLDVGTGPGLPAWPLACARPDLRVTAVDSSGKMLRVLEENPLPNLTAKLSRAEEMKEHERFDVVTGRAVAPLGVQLEVSAPWCKIGGAVIPFRTPSEKFGLDASMLGLELEDVFERSLPGTDVVRTFPVFRKVVKTPRTYPRTWAQIKKRPIGAAL